MCRVQQESVRVERGAGPREVEAQVLRGAVREDVRDLVRLDGGLEERGGLNGVGEVVDCLISPSAGSVGGREGRIYPGAEVRVVDASFDRRGDEWAFEPV